MRIDNKTEQDIAQYFEDRRDQIIQDIFHLVRIRSVSEAGGPPSAPFGEGCARVLDEALALARRMGFTTNNFEYYVGTAHMGEQGEDLGLCTHLDVVPEGNDWIYPPYDPQIVDGHLVGRGVCDDKGPAVLMMYVAACIRDLGLPMRHGIRLMMGCNEECGMHDLEYYVTREKPPRFTLVPDSIYPVNNGEKGRGQIVLCAEKTQGRLREAFCGTRGNLLPDRAYAVLDGLTPADLPPLPADMEAEALPDGVRVTARGIACHATKPETGKSAIGLLFRYLLDGALLEGGQADAARGVLSILSDCNGEGLGIAYSDPQSGLVTHVMGGLEYTGGILRMECTVICPVTMDMDDMRRRLDARMASLGFTVHSADFSAPRYVDPEQPEVKALMEVYNHVHHRPFPPIVTGGTYARMLPDALAFGSAFRESPSPFANGHGGIHKPDECISIDDLLESARIYVLALLELDALFSK